MLKFHFVKTKVLSNIKINYNINLINYLVWIFKELECFSHVTMQFLETPHLSDQEIVLKKLLTIPAWKVFAWTTMLCNFYRAMWNAICTSFHASFDRENIKGIISAKMQHYIHTLIAITKHVWLKVVIFSLSYTSYLNIPNKTNYELLIKFCLSQFVHINPQLML